jgi:hypothetical protein
MKNDVRLLVLVVVLYLFILLFLLLLYLKLKKLGEQPPPLPSLRGFSFLFIYFQNFFIFIRSEIKNKKIAPSGQHRTQPSKTSQGYTG